MRTYYLNIADTERIAKRARALREAAGTLSGLALGEDDGAPQRDVLADVLAVFGSDAGLHWRDARGAARRPVPGPVGRRERRRGLGRVPRRGRRERRRHRRRAARPRLPAGSRRGRGGAVMSRCRGNGKVAAPDQQKQYSRCRCCRPARRDLRGNGQRRRTGKRRDRRPHGHRQNSDAWPSPGPARRRRAAAARASFTSGRRRYSRSDSVSTAWMFRAAIAPRRIGHVMPVDAPSQQIPVAYRAQLRHPPPLLIRQLARVRESATSMR